MKVEEAKDVSKNDVSDRFSLPIPTRARRADIDMKVYSLYSVYKVIKIEEALECLAAPTGTSVMA